jgi:hypothetical protein
MTVIPPAVAGWKGNIMNAGQLAQVLTLFVAIIFPVLVGLVTTEVTNPTVAGADPRDAVPRLRVRRGVARGGELAGVDFDIFSTLITGLGAWVVAVASHFGLWKPTGVSAAAIAVGSKSDPAVA